MTVDEGNRVIAEYMEDEYVEHSDSWIYPGTEDPEYLYRSHKSWRTNELRYSKDWNWIIPVAIKTGMIVVDITDITKTWQDVVQKIRSLEKGSKL